MDLCKKYIETRINKNTEIIQVIGGFKYSVIYFILEVGVNDDAMDKKGLSHLCEHIFLESVSEEFEKNIMDYNFQCMGYTEYSYTIFKFIVSNEKESITRLLKSIDYCINNFSEVSYKHFDNCKKEVIEEAIQKLDSTEKSLKINSFISKEKFNYVPIGDIKHIKSIEFEDVEQHYDKTVGFKLALFTNLEIKNIEKLIDKKVINIKKRDGDKKHICEFMRDDLVMLTILPQNKIQIYFKQKKEKLNYFENVAAYILEIVINLKICKFLGIGNNEISPVFFKKKKFDFENIFNVVYIKNIKKGGISINKEFVDKLVNDIITIEELEEAKYLFIELLNEMEDVDETYIYNNIFHYFICNGLKIITKNQIKKMIKTISKLNNNEIYRVKKLLYTQSYKIIVN